MFTAEDFGNTVDGMTADDMLNLLLEFTGFEDDKTVNFVDSVGQQCYEGRRMSKKQEDTIRKIYHENKEYM